MKDFLTLLIIILTLISCQPQKQDRSVQPVPVFETLEVKMMPYQPEIRTVGTLSSKSQSNLGFMTGGIIKTIRVREGDPVKKGQVLAELDLTEIDSRVRQAELALEKSSRDHERVSLLFNDSVTTLEQLQDSKTAMELARQNLRMARFNLENSRVIAPSNGKIVKIIKEENEIVAQGYPVIVFASTEAGWILKVSLPDRDIVRVKTGDSAKVSFDAYPGVSFAARVMEISNAANLLKGTFDVELEFLQSPPRLVTGLIGSATIFPEKQSLPFIPHVCLVNANGNKGRVHVMVNGVPESRDILIQDISDEGIYTRAGLSPGDTVIAAGTSYMHLPKKP